MDLERGGDATVSPFLVDGFRRRHDYLRISLTERCNLRCKSICNKVSLQFNLCYRHLEITSLFFPFMR